ncbi:hypothetical protein EI94DRAFT_1032792 [Lactarius quietus]|nr:hypothetical protein EI94DRAFT_1032792 [Lactarius quietus]
MWRQEERNAHVPPHPLTQGPCSYLLLRSYPSYSGLDWAHNQRIALENVLALARILNRTLLEPPAHLGSKSSDHASFEAEQELACAIFNFMSLGLSALPLQAVPLRRFDAHAAGESQDTNDARVAHASEWCVSQFTCRTYVHRHFENRHQMMGV